MIGWAINFALILYTLLLVAQILIIAKAVNKNIAIPRWLTKLHIASSFLLLSVFVIFLASFAKNQFQFYQIWSHSSRSLPLYFKIAATWEGQEGSFLLWGTFQTFVSGWLVFQKDKIANYSVAIVLLVQLFLLLPLVHFNLTETEFFLFSNTADVLKIDQNTLAARWALEKGGGMNPLLQNFWMTIHPPVMFLAFALGSIPFAQTLMGVYREDFSWMAASHRSLKLSLAILSLGILMGAYWAYETLSFGGYWSWDPVENAIFLPWLAGLAALHMNWVATKFHKQLGFAAVLNCLYFLLIIYSTFLTRSGLLQNTSVHAFVDNGYQSILTVFLVSMLVLSLFVLVLKRKKIFQSYDHIYLNQKQDWLFIVAVVLLLGALHIFVNTSIPVLNVLLNNVGVNVNFAPPASTMTYAVAQGTGSIILLILLLIVEGSTRAAVRRPMLTVTITGIIFIQLKHWSNHEYAIAVTLVILSAVLFFVLLKKIVQLIRTTKLSGSLISHIGFTFFIIGIIFSHNLLDGDKTLKKHVLLVRSQEKKISGTSYQFEGRFVKDDNGNLIDSRRLRTSLRPGRFIAKDTILTKVNMYYPGDIVSRNNHDLYFKIITSTEKTFFSHVYFENENSYFVTPSISTGILSDTYVNISNFSDSRKITGKDSVSFHFKNIDQASAKLPLWKTNVLQLPTLPGIHLNENRKAYMISLKWNDGDSVCLLNPIVITDGSHYESLAEFSAGEGVGVSITDWKNENDFTVKIVFTEKDWITIQAEEKPLINLFWLGGLLMAMGIFASLKNKAVQKKSEISFKRDFKVPEKLQAGRDLTVEKEKVC